MANRVEEPLPEMIEWSVHPARDRPVATFVVLVVMITLAWLSAVLMENAAWGVFAAVVLVIALNRYFFPSSYTIDAEGITARFPWKRVRYHWSDVRRFHYDGRGGYLSTRARPSMSDLYSGIPLLIDENRELVIARIVEALRKENPL